jgi:pyruvate dehydrogenase E2 component (dihydrolipoamide acetyltransferase)
MTLAVTMPALSDTMGAGRLIKWTKKPGDPVKKGDVIAEVETDKAVMEVEAFQDGYLSGPLAAEGSEAPVGEIIGYIADQPSAVSGGDGANTAAPQAPTAISKTPAPHRTAAAASAAATAASPSPVSAVLAASMVAQRPAAGRSTAPSPPRIHTASTQAAAAPHSLPEAGPPYRIERASSLREAVARSMIASVATPMFHVTAQLTLEPLMAAAKAHGYSVSLVLTRACALTIIAHPLFNAAYTPDGLARRDRVDIGIAVDNGEGLITPVLRDVAARSLSALSADWTKLREQAKSRRLAPADYSGATFYVSDLGIFSVVHQFDSIIPVGASAILSIAASGPQGAFFTLTCDHRVIFGADAARFLQTLTRFLKEPETLFAEEPRS